MSACGLCGISTGSGTGLRAAIPSPLSARYPGAASFRVTLYGSLAATGKGHLTDLVITEVLLGESLSKAPPAEHSKGVELVWKPKEELPSHPNGMNEVRSSGRGGTGHRRGGALLSDEAAEPAKGPEAFYPAETMTEILAFCEESGESFWEYVQRYEGKEIWSFLDQTWEAMCGAIDRGLGAEGVLPGRLGLRRKAYSFFRKARFLGRDDFRSEAFVAAYAYAVAEENACGGLAKVYEQRVAGDLNAM